jgi:hypothetical protein
MKTHVEFRSSAFPAYPEEQDQINPGRFGRRLAEWLVGTLSSAGLEPDEPAGEDWGWRITIPNESFPLWIGCGNYDEYPDGFLCFIEPSKPFVRRWLRKVPTEATVTRIAELLDAALRNHPEIYDLRWWNDHEVRS